LTNQFLATYSNIKSIRTSQSPLFPFIDIGDGKGTTSTFVNTIAATPANSNSATWTTTTFPLSANMTNLHGASDGARRLFSWTPTNTPTVPTTLTFTSVGLSSMTLNWIDNSTTEYAFAVYASSDGGVTFNYVGTTTSSSTAGTGGAYTFSATGLSTNTSYQWQVYAVSEGKYSTALSGTQATSACGTYSGTMTVGPTGTFSNLTTAITNLTACGYTGNIILELQTAYVSTGETFPLTFGTALGSSVSKTITIRPTTGATNLSITSANITGTILVNGADYICFDGRAGGAGTTKNLTL
jgi:hypothetical protein